MWTPADSLINAFKWRIGRKNYILGNLILLLFSTLTVIMPFILIAYSDFSWIVSYSKLPNSEPVEVILVIIACIFFIISAITHTSLTVKRLHDFDRSGWYYLIIFIPWIWFLLPMCCISFKWDLEKNKYGEPHHQIK